MADTPLGRVRQRERKQRYPSLAPRRLRSTAALLATALAWLHVGHGGLEFIESHLAVALLVHFGVLLRCKGGVLLAEGACEEFLLAQEAVGVRVELFEPVFRGHVLAAFAAAGSLGLKGERAAKGERTESENQFHKFCWKGNDTATAWTTQPVGPFVNPIPVLLFQIPGPISGDWPLSEFKELERSF